VDVKDGTKNAVRFNAALGRSFMGAPAGTVVDVEASLFEKHVYFVVRSGGSRHAIPLKVLLG
jgi:hypothetical protein